MKKIKMDKPHNHITVSIKGYKDGVLYRRAAGGDLAAKIIFLCVNRPEKYILDHEILPTLIHMEPERWAITKGGFTYNAAAAV